MRYFSIFNRVVLSSVSERYEIIELFRMAVGWGRGGFNGKCCPVRYLAGILGSVGWNIAGTVAKGTGLWSNGMA